MTDDEGPLPRKQRVVAPVLTTWDVADLQAYIAELRDEIERAEAAINKKQGHKQAAEAFFRLPGKPG